MRNVTWPGLIAVVSVLLGLSLVTSRAQDQSPTAKQFEQFKKHVPGRLPSGHLPEGSMLEPGPELDFRADSQEEAQQGCDAYAKENALRWCTARQSTYDTMREGETTNWYCVCH
jgi:hypothetical protein